MRMLKTPTNQAWHFEKAIPVAADGGGAVGGGAISPELGEGTGDTVPELGEGARDGTGLSSGKTVITSFIPSVQWLGKPHMYQCFPGVDSGITSWPEVRGTAPIGTLHAWKSVPLTFTTL